MNSHLYDTDPLLITGFLLMVLLAGWWIGYALGRGRPDAARDDSAKRVTDASLALMGLLLGFTFAMALSRYDRRRDMVVADSNSIGDFYACISLLKDPATRTPLLKVTRQYAEQRLDLSHKFPTEPAAWEAELQRMVAMQARMTELVGDAIRSEPAVTIPLVNTLNNLTSSHASRLMAIHDRLPPSIVLLLFIATGVSLSLLGWQQGAAGRAHWFSTLGFILLIGAALYTTLDLNQPNRGLIQVDQEPLQRLVESMRTPPPLK